MRGGIRTDVGVGVSENGEMGWSGLMRVRAVEGLGGLMMVVLEFGLYPFRDCYRVERMS
jgi:hypothetical protein